MAKYNVGDVVIIKPAHELLDEEYVVYNMQRFSGSKMKISSIELRNLPEIEVYRMEEDEGDFFWTDEMILRKAQEIKIEDIMEFLNS